MRVLVFVLLVVASALPAFGQQAAVLEGRLVNSLDGQPLTDATVVIDEVKRDKPDYFFSDRYRDVWFPALKRFILTRFEAQIQESVEDPDNFELSPEWAAELDRRLDGILSGKTKGIPAKEAFASVRRALKERRAARGKKTSH